MSQEVSLSESDRYGRRSILRSEFIYGRGFQSPGGVESTAKYAATLDIGSAKKTKEQPVAAKILEFGCGLGGASFFFAQTFGAQCTAVDFSQNMVDICNERLAELEPKPMLQFKQGSALDVNLFEPESFDLIWCRDMGMYIEERNKVWSNFYKWLKPGGQFFLTDFGLSAHKVSQEFHDYYKHCHYHLEDMLSYATRIQKEGFDITSAEDISIMFNELNKQDLEKFEANKQQFVSLYSEDEFKHIQERWVKKIKYTTNGDMKWIKIVSRKP